MPRVSYFPTFLVDLPERIYLKEHEGERAVNRYYRLVMQEILRSIDPKLSIDRHVIKRIEDFKAAEKTPLWLAVLFGAPTKSHIDSVFQKIANAVSREVIGSWTKVFQRPSGARNVLVDWNVDPQKQDLPYASFYVSDGESRYAVSERSLGFRWFFSFLLFTAFKQAASRPTLFLFDEPAANLHARAQAELLKNFHRIASGGSHVIYSTHSHHMIDPRWLSSAYIVENAAIDYDATDGFELNSAPTQIKATPYRHFVSQHPHRTSYFQPVIETLEYVTPELVGRAPYLILEGITDYYALRYFKEKAGSSYASFSLMPGAGAGASGPLISFLLGRGESFLVLLDDDEAGRRARDKYQEGWFLPSDMILTLGDLNVDHKGKRLEALISDQSRTAIAAETGCVGEPSKKEIGLYLAELCALTKASVLSAETEKSFRSVLDEVNKRLARH